MSDFFERFAEEEARRSMFRLSLYRPTNFVMINNIAEVDPRQALDDLRDNDPDGYANLTEHIVMPWEDK